ncbi:MAG: hypothetical protein DRN12_01780 [Thermoplasmata archaeon]|nr:MAG: hypothetical protein DRN12_01780 [Thermoplasmata archaeon]HEC89532.1 hypothetical protein [Thermoplasmatales archaeon]
MEYIEEIEKKNPYEFLLSETKRYLSLESSEINRELGVRFHKDIISTIDRYEKEVDPAIIVKVLFNVFLDFIKHKAIESKALSLGIEPSLYKKQMGFLFKGKKL